MSITNKPYWTNKDDRAKVAKEHFSAMKKYDNQLVANIVYGTPDPLPSQVQTSPRSSGATIDLREKDSVSALFDVTKEHKGEDKRICVLNFASFKNPGGGFLKGSRAQEESLCLESNLYNALLTSLDYYEWNNKNLNRALYKNRALYSKDIYFTHKGEECHADVLTCAAPNYNAASKYQNVSKEENDQILRSRIEFVRDILCEQKVDIAVLGAFGCGVFGQDAYTVAQYLFEAFDLNENVPVQAVYAVPGFVHRENYTAFAKASVKAALP